MLFRSLILWNPDQDQNDGAGEYLGLWYGGTPDEDAPNVSITAGSNAWAVDDDNLEDYHWDDTVENLRQVNIDIRRNSDGKLLNWHFDESGNLYLPAQPDLVGTAGIVFADGTVQTTAATGNSVAELTGDGYASGTGFKRTVYTNYTGYQGGESTTVWISPADAIGVNDGDTITFRDGNVRTITGNVAGNDGGGDYVQL